MSTEGHKKRKRGKTPTPRRKPAKGGTAAAAPHRSFKASDYSFPVDYCDQFETPRQAYADIVPVLQQIQADNKRDKLRIWDPFYCNGAVKAHLQALGFDEVYNENEDAYRWMGIDAARVRKTTPHLQPFKGKWDAIVTNPPYSEDHKQRVLKWLASEGRPWLTLLPAYVATKEYFAEAEAIAKQIHGQSIVFIAPGKPIGGGASMPRYQFEHPDGTGHADSPFDGIWFCGLPQQLVPNVIRSVRKPDASSAGSSSTPIPQAFGSVKALAAAGLVSLRKRPNPRQRRRKHKTGPPA